MKLKVSQRADIFATAEINLSICQINREEIKMLKYNYCPVKILFQLVNLLFKCQILLNIS